MATGTGLLPVPLPDPLGNLGGLVVRAVGSALVGGISHAAGWALAGLVHALTATTTVDVSVGGWFGGPWRAMLAVAALVSMPVLVIGVTAEALAGRPGEALRRAVVAPAVISVGTVATPVLASGVLALVSSCCALLVNLGAGGPDGLGRALARLPTDAAAASGPQLPLVVAALMAVVVGVLAFVVWVELAARAGLLYLVVLFTPVGLAGMWWRHTTVWLRRLVEVFVAIAMSQLVITAAMVIAAAALANGRLDRTTPGASVDTLVTAIGLLLLGTLGLPMALRVVPHAAEGAIAAGVGARGLSAARGSGRGAAAGASASLGTPSATTVSRLTSGAAAGGPAGVAAAAVVAGAQVARRAATAGVNGAAAAVPAPGQATSAPPPAGAPGPSPGAGPGGRPGGGGPSPGAHPAGRGGAPRNPAGGGPSRRPAPSSSAPASGRSRPGGGGR